MWVVMKKKKMCDHLHKGANSQHLRQGQHMKDGKRNNHADNRRQNMQKRTSEQSRWTSQ